MLPGKLCIGILEEDNPQKSYFRMKPLLVEEDGRYAVFEGGNAYPEEGCIRIVPDKNESSHFKARMRRMGRYCVLDLREHAGENDKIRPNKNYHGDEIERNANIVYSDVVREPAADMIFEIISGDAQQGDFDGAAPGTPRLLRGDENETWAYTAPEAEDAPGSIAPDGQVLDADEIQRFEIPGFPGETLRFAIRLPGAVGSVTAVPAARAEAQTIPAPAAEAPAQAKSVQSEPAPEPEKPWISHDLPPKPAPVHGRMSPLEQALAAQSGLNPKRNRSLQEIIEEKWRHSRVDQLGHPVPANAMGKPVENPLEHALEALRDAWRIPEIRERLVGAIAEIQDFASRLDARRRSMEEESIRHELEDLEAERLKTLGEIEKLRRDKAALRDTFRQEIRREEAEAFREAVEKTNAARKEQEKYEAAAAQARKNAEFAQDAFASLSDGRFEEKLREFALTSRAAELIARPAQEIRPVVKPSDEEPSREEWIVRMKRAMAAEGLETDDIQAANLLVCAALGDSLLLSGPASSDKCAVARALARALGAADVQRYAEFAGGFPADDAKAELLAEASELPAVALVREANCAPGADIGCGLIGAAENLVVVSAVMDGGCGFPVAAEALERGFMVRLQSAGANTPWKPARKFAGEFTPVRFCSLRKAFLSEDAEVPAALERRLQKLRDALAMHGVRLSRNTLNRMWDYCAAMLALGKLSPAEVLDYAFAQKALPCILAEAPVECLAELKKLLAGMNHSLALLDAPLPILI